MWSRRGVAVLLIAFGLLCFLPPFALADGIVMRRGGGNVREREQHAYIAWQDGQETLYVATVADALAEPTVWIIPVPGSPDKTKARAVKELPKLEPGFNIAFRATVDLKVAALLYSLPDTCYVSGCVILPRMSFAGKSQQVGDVAGWYHDEQFGLVVETITAKSVDGLDRYLAAHSFGIKAATVTALAPYIGEDYTLVCCWRSGAKDEPTGRAVRIEFPCERLYFPLQASRMEPSWIDTSIVVRGWVRPAPGGQADGVRCNYVRSRLRSDEEESGPVQDYTVVYMNLPPRNWNNDLWLEDGCPLAIAAAALVVDHGEKLGFEMLVAIGAGLGVLLGLAFAFLCARPHRRWWDFVWCGSAGASAIVAMIFPVALFFIWLCLVRDRNMLATSNERSLWWMTRLAYVFGFVVTHFTVLVIGPFALAGWISTYG